MNRKLMVSIFMLCMILSAYSQADKPEKSSCQTGHLAIESLSGCSIKASAKYVKNLYGTFIAERFAKAESVELVKASLAVYSIYRNCMS